MLNLGQTVDGKIIIKTVDVLIILNLFFYQIWIKTVLYNALVHFGTGVSSLLSLSWVHWMQLKLPGSRYVNRACVVNPAVEIWYSCLFEWEEGRPVPCSLYTGLGRENRLEREWTGRDTTDQTDTTGADNLHRTIERLFVTGWGLQTSRRFDTRGTFGLL